MTTATHPTTREDSSTLRTATYREQVVCARPTGTLYDVLDLILDRGMVIDVFVRVSLVGIEILKIDARVVVASVDTYLKFAEACNRIDLEMDSRSRTVPELFGGGPGGVAGEIGKKKAKSMVGSAKESVTDTVRGAFGKGGSADEGEAGEEERESSEERPRRGSERSRAQRSRGRHSEGD